MKIEKYLFKIRNFSPCVCIYPFPTYSCLLIFPKTCLSVLINVSMFCLSVQNGNDYSKNETNSISM